METKSKEKINLMGLNKQALEDFFISLDEKPFRATQIIKWIHQRGVSDISQMTDLSKNLREKLMDKCEIRVPEVVYEKTSKDGTKKWVIKVGEKDLIEMVLIPEKNRSTLCVSSQVGCAVDCSFCATGKQGFSRNLGLDEIIGQVWVAANSFGLPREPNSRHITNVVMMGMGEPLLNFENVMDAVDLMMDEGLLEEARSLHPQKELNALQTVGYRELFAHFDGEYDLETAVSEIKKNTRRYAKRQVTWFRKYEDAIRFEGGALVEDLIKLM